MPLATFTMHVAAQNIRPMALDHTFRGPTPGPPNYEIVPGREGKIEVTITVPEDGDTETIRRRVALALEDLGMWGP